MAFERAKDRLGSGGDGRRYPRGDGNDLEDVSNPHTIEDESSRAFKEYIFRYRWHVLGVGVLVLAVVGILLIYTVRFVPQLLANEWVRRIAIVGGLLGLGFFLGNKSTKGSLANRDELVLIGTNGVNRYLGKYKYADQADFPTFEAIKGFAWFGLVARPYTVGDLGPDVERRARRGGVSPDAPAVIRLHPEMAEIAKTDTGTVIAQLSGGLVTDPFGRGSNVAASLPDLADEGRISKLKRTIRDLQEKLQNAKDDADVYRIQRNEAREEAKKHRQEILEEWKESYVEVRQAETTASRTSQRDDGLGPEPSTDTIQAVDQEVTNGDD